MRIRPRQQILDVWRALLDACYVDGRWTWGSGDEADSISDAEQLLCLMHPMNEIESFALSDPDEIRDDVFSALRPLGGVRRIPKVMTEISIDFFERHTDEAGEPTFACTGYRGTFPGAPPATREQREAFTVVDAYARSVTLSLAVLAFAKRRLALEMDALGVRRLEGLRDLASRRLTAAMTGLLRSFVVHSVDLDSAPGAAIMDVMRRPESTDSERFRHLNERFRRLRTQLLEGIRLAVPDSAKPDDDQLFEVGWAWGITAISRPVDLVEGPITRARGYAEHRPSLYFTVSALDSITDLQSRRTRSLSLLDEVQLQLADALALRWDITQRYWSIIARFDAKRWPLSDLPWRTSDQEESDYYSLLVLSIVIHDLTARATSVPDNRQVVEIIEELAQRGRITRRMAANDAAIVLHDPGEAIRLFGSDVLGPQLIWPAADYAPLLLKRAYQAVQLTSAVEERERLIAVAESAMDHLHDRRIARGRGAGLWDDVSRLQPGRSPVPEARLSWSQTERVVEALVTTANAYVQEPPRSNRMAEIALRLLNEADHLYNQELLDVDADDRSVLREHLERVEALIYRARELQGLRVNTSIALTEEALRMLDVLAQAREDAERGR